jgi:hypothetical protein
VILNSNNLKGGELEKLPKVNLKLNLSNNTGGLVREAIHYMIKVRIG